MAYPGIPPDGLGVESCTMTATTPTFRVLLGWENSVDYESLHLQKSANGLTWTTVSEDISGESTTYIYNGADYDQGTYYRIRGYITDSGYTNWSNTAYKAIWFSSVSDTATGGELMSDAAENPGESIVSDTAVATDSVTDSVNVLEIITDTATASDAVMDVALEKLVLARYLGSNNGKLYLIDNDVHGDNANVIQTWWESKDIDMDDQYPQFIGKFKYLHGVKLRYVDLGETTTTVYVSTDGGNTWTNNTKTFGTGSGTPKEKIFNFWIHGRTFMVRLYNSSATSDFQYTDLELMFEPAGDYFEIS